MEEIDLIPSVPETLLLKTPFLIKVKFLPCPLGFSLLGNPPKCDCAPPLNESPVLKCNIHNQTIRYPAGMWLGYNGLHNFNVNTSTAIANSTTESSGIIQHSHCPIDYCKHGFTDINFEEEDEQCLQPFRCSMWWMLSGIQSSSREFTMFKMF